MNNYKFESMTIATLQSLINNQAVEDLHLEFKRYNFENGKVPDKEKNDLLKEITSLANADGGQIIIGIDEEGNGVDPYESSDSHPSARDRFLLLKRK